MEWLTGAEEFRRWYGLIGESGGHEVVLFVIGISGSKRRLLGNEDYVLEGEVNLC